MARADRALALDPEQVHRQVRAILAEGRFHQPPVPRPLHGLLHALDRVLAAPVEALERLIHSVGKGLPGGPPVLWAALALLLLATFLLFFRRNSRRRLAGAPSAQSSAPPGRTSARDLESLADAAERQGRFADSVRLRFRAGLLLIAERSPQLAVASTPNAELAEQLASAHFTALAGAFDQIAYGNRRAGRADAEAARIGWRALLKSLPAVKVGEREGEVDSR